MSKLPKCYCCHAQPCTCEDGQTVYAGDVRQVLPQLPADHFHCVVTSPPYFALRSYLKADDPLKQYEIGSEPTPEQYIETMVKVFREVRRVMHPTGLLFLNLGDSYGSSGGVSAGNENKGNAGSGTRAARTGGDGQLLNMPHRVAEALRADGWLWRQTIVWAKRSPMPESCKGWRWERCRVKVERHRDNAGLHRDDADVSPVTSKPWATYSPCPGCEKCILHGGYVLRKEKGRCTTAHEYIFVMSKSPVYFWDSAAFVEESLPASVTRQRAGYKVLDGDAANHYGDGFQRGPGYEHHTRNPRSVWTLSSEPTSVPHFATFLSELVRRCRQAGTSDGGCCPACGMPWAPVVDSERYKTRPGNNSKVYVDPEGSPYEQHSGSVIGNRDPQRHCTETTILGYRPTCECEAIGSSPCRVLDPFLGIGTTLQTANEMGRLGVGIELNDEYLQHVEATLSTRPRWWKRKHAHEIRKREKDIPGQRMLF